MAHVDFILIVHKWNKVSSNCT